MLLEEFNDFKNWILKNKETVYVKDCDGEFYILDKAVVFYKNNEVYLEIPYLGIYCKKIIIIDKYGKPKQEIIDLID